jgi:phosphate:Na+ symporter
VETANIVLSLLGALALFLLGLDWLSEALQSIGPERMKPALTRFSQNPLFGLLTGLVVTAVLDSSSAVIVMLVALVNARALAFPNALGMVLGANIGTTLGSQIIALDLTWLGPTLLAVGVFGRLLIRHKLTRYVLGVVQGLGLLFLGLALMDVAVHPLREWPQVLGALRALENPWQGALAGAIVTVVLQSSSATVGMAIGLCNSAVLTLPAGVAVMIGAEVGTCADTVLAAVGRSRAALRVGVFHLTFNLISALVGVALVGPLTWAAVAVAPGAGVGQHLANAHMMFNIGGALLALPLVGLAARLLERAIPDTGAAEGVEVPAG